MPGSVGVSPRAPVHIQIWRYQNGMGSFRMTKVFDYTADCYDGKYQRIDDKGMSLIWIHRIGPGIGTNAVEIARFFIKGEGKSYTGGQMAYHYINTLDQIQQALPLDEKGAHARRWGNAFGLGFAQVGDFNKVEPRPEQWNRAVDMCADMVPGLSRHSAKTWSLLPRHLKSELPIVGHGEVPGSYGSTSGKEQPNGSDACPGRLWNMDEFREDVEAILQQRTGERLTELGHTFTAHG